MSVMGSVSTLHIMKCLKSQKSLFVSCQKWRPCHPCSQTWSKKRKGGSALLTLYYSMHPVQKIGILKKSVITYMSNVISPARLSNQSQTILIGRVWRMRRGEPMNRGCLNVSDVSDAWGLAKTPASLLGFSICPASQKSVELMVLSHQYTEKRSVGKYFK